MANFTAIATGAAANAATVNGPLGQLDTAIGALSGLPTTDKASIVSSIVEMYTDAFVSIGTLAGLSTTEQSSLVAALNELYAKTITGGIYITQTQLKEWTEAGAYEPTSITMDTTYPLVAASATVKWPDGSAGTYTATTINTTWETTDAYTITHDTSSYTVTQAAVTRNVDGRVTTKPALTVSI